jgi:hypothetical protein
VPNALAKACHVYGCPHPEPCPVHGRSVRQQQYDDRRGSARARGYDREWDQFRLWHLTECFRLEVPRVGLCGSRLPGAPATEDSECARLGLITPARVLDHITPITGPTDPRRLDPTNLQWLCDGVTGRGCHDRKRQRERGTP